MTELLTTGSGEPITVFAPGARQSIAQTRPFGSGVRGTKVFFQYSEPDLVAEFERIADDAGATRAFGASLGARTLMGLLANRPDRFERLVIALPAVLGNPYEAMRKVSAPVLIVGQHDDHLHPARIAERLGTVFPSSTVRIFPPGGLLTAHRAEVRESIAGFLNTP